MSLPSSLEKRHTFNRADGILIGVILVLSVFLLIYPFLWRNRQSGNLYCRISWKGEVVETIDLSELKNEEERCIGGVTVFLSPDDVHIAASTCKGQDCVHTGSIHQAGQSLVCLPNQVVVALYSEAQSADLVLG